MKLLIDIGNTRSKFALANGVGVQPAFEVDHADLTEGVLESHCSDTLKLSSAWISSVGPNSVFASIDLWISRRFKILPEKVLVSEERCGISNGYHDLEKLGVDRWVAAIGARSLHPANDLIIVDAGTAITVDWLSRNDVFEGGVIIPGYALMHSALVDNTAGIKSSVEPTQRIIGKTTHECVNSGLSFGVAGAVERIVIEMQQHINMPSKVILTGGFSSTLAQNLKFDFVADQHLVLTGLAAIARSDI